MSSASTVKRMFMKDHFFLRDGAAIGFAERAAPSRGSFLGRPAALVRGGPAR